MKEHLSKLLTREQAYFIHASLRLEFSYLLKIHKNKIDIATYSIIQEVVHDIIKHYTEKEEK